MTNLAVTWMAAFVTAACACHIHRTLGVKVIGCQGHWVSRRGGGPFTGPTARRAGGRGGGLASLTIKSECPSKPVICTLSWEWFCLRRSLSWK